MKLRRLPFHILARVGFYREIRIGGFPCADDAPYYVIRRANRWGEAGFFSNYFYVLSHFAYALREGWKPVVDMRNYRTLYSERKPVDGERNAWNYYFRQPHSTREAYLSGRFILSACDPRPEFNPIAETNATCDLDPAVAPELLRIASGDLSLRPELVDRFQREFDSLFRGRRVLGVHYRGGDKHDPPPGHRMSIPMEKLLAAIDGLLAKGPDAIFLASDEEGAADRIRTVTSVPVVELSARRLPAGSMDGLHTREGRGGRPMHRYLLGLEVLRDAWFLSRCDLLVHGHSNVSSAAMFLRGSPYEQKVLVESGAPAGSGKKI